MSMYFILNIMEIMDNVYGLNGIYGEIIFL